MAVSTDPNDPDFGIETDPNHPDFGTAPSTTGEPQSSAPSVQEQQAAASQIEREHPILTGAVTKIGQDIASLVPKSVSEIPRALGQLTPATQGIEDTYRAAKNLYDVAVGGKTISEVSPQGKSFSEFTPYEWGQFGGTIAGQLAIAALIGRGVVPKGIAPATESVVRSELEKPPVQAAQEVVPTKPEAFPSLLQSAEDIRRTELSKPISPEEMGQTIGKTWRSTQGGEPNAVEPSNAQVETGQTAQRIEERPAGEVPAAGRSDNVVGEAQGATARGQVPGAEARQGTEAQPQAQVAPPVSEGGQPPVTPIQPKPEVTSPEASAAVEPQKTTAIPAEAPAPTTAVKTGVSSARFGEQYGDLAPVANTGKTAAELKATGQSRLDNFQKTGAAKDDPYAVVTNLREGKVPVTQIADDLSLLRAEHQRLRSAAAAAEGTPEYARKIQDAVDMANTIKEVGHGPGSDIMRSFQEYDQPKYDNLTDFELAMRERTGNELTANERSQFERIAKDRGRTRDIASNEVDVAQKQIQRFRGREKMSFEDAAKKIQDQITELTKDCII